MPAEVRAYLSRIANTFWQSFVSAISVAQLTNALSGANLGAVKLILLGAVGAAVAAIITFLKNTAFKPTASGATGIAERVVSTFVEGAAGAIPVQIITAAISNVNASALQSVALTALGGGIAAVLSLMQHLSTTPEPPPAVAPFVFHGDDGTNIAAYSIAQFTQLALAVSDTTWTKHLLAHDYSTWIRTSLGNPALAATVMEVEDSGDPSDTTRHRIVAAIQANYTIMT